MDKLLVTAVAVAFMLSEATVNAALPSRSSPANITLTVVKVDVHSASLSWVVSDTKAVRSYEIHYSDGKMDVRVRGMDVNATSLMTTTVYLPESAKQYNICVAAILTDLSLPPAIDCAEVRTLELIRADSLLVVLLVVAFIMSLVALAYAAWRYRVYKQAHECGYKPSAGNTAEAAYLTAHDREGGA